VTSVDEAPEEAPRKLPAPLDWFAGRVTGRDGHSGALVPAGWAAYNAVWLAVMGGLDIGRRGGAGVDWPIWVFSGSIAITILFAFLVVFSRWRHPLEPRQRPVSLRGDASLCGAMGIMFAGLAAVFGSWWGPFSAVMVVMAIWLFVKDSSARHRHPDASG
jgi:hypothetical protein